MDVNYSFSETAKYELKKAQCYFNLIGREDDFFSDLIIQLNKILLMPFAFQIRYKNVRLVHLEDFNYTIHYMVLNDEIVILNILNQSQDF